MNASNLAKETCTSDPDPRRLKLEAYLELWGAEVDAAINLVCSQGRRWAYVAGPTRALPAVPPQRIQVAERVALMIYGRGPIKDSTLSRLVEKARHAGVASTAIELSDAVSGKAAC